MSSLYTFCISNAEEKDDYSEMADRGLDLDRADFAVSGYEVDERRYPRQGPKEPSSSGKKVMKADDAIVNLSESTSSSDDDDMSDLGQANPVQEIPSLEGSDFEMDEAHSEGQPGQLIGSRLGAGEYNDDENEDLIRLRIQATPRKLFDSSSQPSPSAPEYEHRPSFATPPGRRSQRLAAYQESRKETAMDDPETPVLVASQASVSQTATAPADMTQMMLNFMQQMKDSQEASDRRNDERMEHHRQETVTRLEEQRRDMAFHLEQQRLDMAAMTERTMQSMVNQVPFIVQNALLGLGAVMNVPPLQLKAPSSSQPSLLLMEQNRTPEGSGNSTRGESSRKRKGSPSHLSAQPNPRNERSLSPPKTLPESSEKERSTSPQKTLGESSDKERSTSPSNTLADFNAITMQDDEPGPSDAPAAG